MKRLSIIILATLAAATPALAADEAFCTSMCASEQRECRASAQALPLEQRLTGSTAEYRNPLARTAQGAVPGQATRALDAAGDNGRRMARLGACDTALQRCTRSCAAQPDGAQSSPLRQPPVSPAQSS
ncbi:hypothetical protein ABIB42_004959 [Massilia sp. UYP32]|uniref:Uncharacterized protein n=1 Tax=Massilia timonae CCUG 45783 TaxID=883126 RepID=K9D8E2_9BURK|nr:hypothetical protein [Massilia timonae]EKU80508.1 hypothetical protein HMPREF9710_04047 [Massilia timonae CCUG 45783]HAK91320.1 hypothetical protein [Massilia timonae]